jgi:hypothetical protein
MGYKSNFQKKKMVVDTAFSNGMNWTRAYMDVMGVESPDIAKRSVYKMKQSKEVEDYIKFKESELELKYGVNKDKIVRDLIDMIDDCKNPLTATDRHNWLKGLDMLNKMFGYYTPEKVEHKHDGIVINIVKPKKDEDIEE